MTSDFSLNCMKIMTKLLEKNAYDEDMYDVLKLLELEYYNLVEKNEILEEQINIDNKTHLLKYNENYIVNIVKTASRVLDRPTLKEAFYISYVRIDIDDFSVINNLFGHNNADKILVDIAGIIKQIIRPTDYAIRFGGEEFDLLLPSTKEKYVSNLLDKIFKAIRNIAYNFKNQNLTVTVSAGYSTLKIPYSILKSIDILNLKNSFTILQDNVDNALYDAKNSGKDCYKKYSKIKNYKKIREEYIKSK